jgi:hypothetical protein
MSTNIREQANNKVNNASTARQERTPLSHQTGQVLVTFGMLFKHVPPFNETIDKNTGETLIAIGRKLISAQQS